MTAPAPADYPDWTTPISSVASSRLIYSAAAAPLPIGAHGLDISAYQTVELVIGLTSVTVGNAVTVTVTWSNKAGQLFSELYVISEANSSASGIERIRTIQLPARGTIMDVSLNPDIAGASASMTIYGSSRPLARTTIAVSDDYGPNAPVKIVGLVLAAGISTAYYFGPVSGTLIFTYTGTGAGTKFTMQTATVAGGAINWQTIYIDTPAAGVEKVVPIGPPPQLVKLSINNTGTGSSTVAVDLTSVPA